MRLIALLACALLLAGCGSESAPTDSHAGHHHGTASLGPSDRTVTFDAKDFAFDGLETFTGKVGEKVRFELRNVGHTVHELRLQGPGGTSLGGVGHTDPDKTSAAVIELPRAGTYTYVCAIDDHTARGMKGTFTVS